MKSLECFKIFVQLLKFENKVVDKSTTSMRGLRERESVKENLSESLRENLNRMLMRAQE